MNPRNPKKLIMDFLKQNLEQQAPGEKSVDYEKLHMIRDGMGAGTAMLVIEQHVDGKIGKDYQIEGLENAGRYYLAKIVQHDGGVVQRMIIDKENGNIRLV